SRAPHRARSEGAPSPRPPASNTRSERATADDAGSSRHDTPEPGPIALEVRSNEPPPATVPARRMTVDVGDTVAIRNRLRSAPVSIALGTGAAILSAGLILI